ncbi:hypothetical protein [Pseudarthrobacter sp. PS3-L1]|uniref:hypothetical protein n=1 Tax=Pseudarthrobacter sp. PS3-L1 TaxID=3046207 RepID=UPI0024B890C9|nr:hypothetical protein [Pseudarthrobacter sp. PS3-L1]MDJ0321725.1 hypothetical protein [Pseudarthrobacter sp. PS3-L1]
MLTWSLDTREEAAILRQNSSAFQVTSATPSHFYTLANRTVGNFLVPPDASVIEFVPGQKIILRGQVEASPGIETAWALIGYSAEGEPTVALETNGSMSVELETTADTQFVSAALRVKGKGDVNAREIEIQAIDAYPIGEISRVISLEDCSAVEISMLAYDSNPLQPASALLTFSFRDESGAIVHPIGSSAINGKLGAYTYVNLGNIHSPAETKITVDVPPSSQFLHISGVPWKHGRQVVVLGSPHVRKIEKNRSELQTTEDGIREFIDSIPEDGHLIVFYTTAPPLGHETLALRPNRLAKEYEKLGKWIVFFPFSKVTPGTESHSEKSHQISRENMGIFLEAVAARTGMRNVFICSSFPDIQAVAAFDYLKLHNWQLIYEVRDDMEEFNRVGYSKWFNPLLEQRIASRADKIITVSPRLASKMNVISGRKDSIVVANGVASELVSDAAPLRVSKLYAERDASTIVGYIGHLTPSWFDWTLIISAAIERPNWTFEIIGHGMPDNLVLPKNITFLGPKPHSEFVEIAARWKVGIIPFKASALTYAVDPNKIYEYLALGLRVVTAAMGSVALCPVTHVYEHRSEFVQELSDAMQAEMGTHDQEAIEEFLKQVTWDERAYTMLSIFDDTNKKRR